MQKSGLLEALPIQTTVVWFFRSGFFMVLYQSRCIIIKGVQPDFGVSTLACKRLLILVTTEKCRKKRVPWCNSKLVRPQSNI